MGVVYNDPFSTKLMVSCEKNMGVMNMDSKISSKYSDQNPDVDIKIEPAHKKKSRGIKSADSNTLPMDKNCLKSASLATLVHRYFEEEEEEEPENCSKISSKPVPNKSIYPTNSLKDTESEEGYNLSQLSTILNRLSKFVDERENKLYFDVSSILKSFNEGNSRCSIICRQRFLLTQLKFRGYDAAICKSQWSHSQMYYGGDFEYMDVIFEDENGSDRLLVDIDFSGQFQIARPTSLYAYALESIPSVFVGRVNRLLKLVDLLGDAAIKSLKANNMLLPPWRKLEYMRIKWLAQHVRTTDSPSSSCSPSCRRESVLVKSNRARGTDTSPIVLDLEEGQETDLVYYKGKVFDMKHENVRPFDRLNLAGAIPSLKLKKISKEEINIGKQFKVLNSSANMNSQWEFPAVNLKNKKKSALTACFVESELSRQLKGGSQLVK